MMLIAGKLPKKKGMVVFLPSTIGGCITDITNQENTVVYTDTFPNGVTIEMPITDFAEAWHTALMFEDYEVEITQDAVSEVQH